MTLPNVVIAFLVVTVLALFGQKAGFWAQPKPAVVAVAVAPAATAALAPAAPAAVAPAATAAVVPAAPAAVVPAAPAAVAPAAPAAVAPAAPAAVVPAVPVAPAVVAAPAVAPPSVAAAPALPDGQESIDILPAGAGREDTFLACTICHNTALIRRSGFSRDRWDELMDWMVEKQGMNPLDPSMRTSIVDYLAAAFPPRQGPRGRNPFAAP